jgi:hypothetical protein
MMWFRLVWRLSRHGWSIVRVKSDLHPTPGPLHRQGLEIFCERVQIHTSLAQHQVKLKNDTLKCRSR